MLRWCCGAVIGVAVFLALAIGLLAIRFAMGPIEIDGLSDRVEQALAERMGARWSVDVGTAVIDHTRDGPTLRVTDVDVRNPSGLRVLHAASATLAVDPWALVAGRFTPKAVEFAGLDLRLTVARGGDLSLSAAEDDEAPAAAPGQAKPAALPLAVGAASLVDLLATREGVFGGLDRVELKDARLTLVDARRRPRAVFSNGSLAMQRPKSKLVLFSFGLRGRTGPWTLSGSVSGLPGEARQATMTLTDVPVSDVLLLGGLTNALVTTDMPLSGEAHIAIDAGGELTDFEAGLKGAAAIVHVDDPDMPPIKVDEVAIATAWDRSAGELVVRSATFAGGRTRFDLAGRLSPGPEGTPWQLSLSGRNAVLEGFGPQDPDLRIDEVSVALAGVAGGGMAIERLAVSGDGYGVALSGTLGTDADAGGLRLGLSTARSAVRPILRLWPVSIAPDVRRYLVDNLRSGIVEELNVGVSLSGEELRDAQAKKPIPDKSVKIDFRLSETEFWPAETVPPLAQATVRGAISGRSATVRVPAAQARISPGYALALSEGVFNVPDTAAEKTPATVDFRITGTADALVALLAEQGAAMGRPIDLDPATVKGQVDMKASLAMPLSRDLKNEEVATSASGMITNLSIDPVYAKERLEDATLALTQDHTTLTLKGEGRVGGLPAQIEVNQPRLAGPGDATLILTMDDAARAKRGLALGKQLTGPVVVKLTESLSKADKTPARIEVDLGKAAINEPLPGWSKAAGKPGKATFSLRETNDGYALDDLAVDAGATVRGRVELAADGALTTAEFSQVKLSPGDDLKVTVDRTKTGYRAGVKGNVLDARPFLRSFMSAGSATGTAGDKLDLDLDLSVNIVAGYNDEALSNTSLKFSKRGKDIRDLQLTGRFGKAPVSVLLSRAERAGENIVVQAADAGSTLRFIDLYKRMAGGDLTMQLSPDGGEQAGSLVIRDFGLRNEPALRRILAEQPASGDAARVDVADIPFTKLKADFTRAPGRINIRDGVVWGPQVGVSLQGHIDTARERVDLSGTYVPAYALNNIFSQVPIVGLILGGGRYEGLFAINFRVTGPLGTPSMTINPLSAIAPGIFRKFFDVGRADSGPPGPPASRSER
ncbi:AsmA-like C-terminal region-containing protein [Chelatococcus sp. SYSU_G07232]|uniref:AsmA-like C-terminal region-containing protein n=1 Tax=Chelatococcus albus TaxID=3047466 RepID=A0ABT7AD15_9HYPH|nr:AsmA-like C-terminal region-containing protein [Chelatococcus sp. SYSU_G07232]MDJ1156714.1 AsmA-like C-terminal region-containing protein [Chelatococcus sp. SYSU_G07232]